METKGARETRPNIGIERLENLNALWKNSASALQWTCPFVLPPWLNAWHETFRPEALPLVVVVRKDETVLGVAPFMLQDRVIRFLGSPDVCDYFDWVVVPGEEEYFYSTLIAYLSILDLRDLHMGPLRPESTLLKQLERDELHRPVRRVVEKDDVCLEVSLPDSWDGFLYDLDGKQRHELRRKLRRLKEAGNISFRKIDTPAGTPEAVETFLRLFTMNRADKAAFMTGQMASFFRALAFAMAEAGLLRLFFLELEGHTVASAFCFDYQGTRYLYNSGYDDAYQGASVGLMTKVLSLEDAIDEGLHTYNFLKGGEAYKYRLGGKEVPLSRCRLTL
jgi:CelD/BcsL family acetyltransferase involved in cellulose biosynthesis